MKPWKIMFMLGLAMLNTACNETPPTTQAAPAPTLSATTDKEKPSAPKQDSAETLFSNAHCAISEGHVRWLNDAHELSSVVSQPQSQGLPAEMQGAVDFAAEQAILIAMGMQPTPGYNITYIDHVRSANEISIRVRWIEPDKNRILPQVITTPCMIVKLPRGTQKSIVIKDEQGLERLKGQ